MSSYWQGKGAGKRIAIRFTKPLLGDVTGNETAFTVKGMVRSPLKYGPLVERTFDVASVERYPLEQYWQDDFAGDMDGLEAGEYGLRLEAEVGKALSFNGSSNYIKCNKNIIPSQNNWTLEAHIQINKNANTANRMTIASQFSAGDSGRAIIGRLLYSSADGCWNIDLSSGTGAWRGLEETRIGEIYSGINCCISIVVEQAIIKIYIDGEFQGSSPQSETIGAYNTTFGYRSDGAEYFHGTIDDVRVWNVARTQQQIADNMNKELTGNETGLVGYWKFNEGSGLTAYDSAGSNNGTINGATWTDGIISSYPDTASRTLSLDATELPESPRFRCEASIPDDTAIIIEYTCTDGSEPDSEDWAEIEDGDLLTITGTTLWLRYTLTTDDPAVTPTLLSAWLEEATAPPGTILLTMTPDSRFNDVEGNITISYEREKGTLTGNRPVEDFTESFTPTGLEPTPLNVQGTITAGIELAVDLIEVDYVDIYHKHTIAAGITVEVDLIPVSGIPP